MYNKRRFLSFFLALSMLSSTFSTTVFALDSSQQSSLIESVDLIESDLDDVSSENSSEDLTNDANTTNSNDESTDVVDSQEQDIGTDDLTDDTLDTDISSENTDVISDDNTSSENAEDDVVEDNVSDDTLLDENAVENDLMQSNGVPGSTTPSDDIISNDITTMAEPVPSDGHVDIYVANGDNGGNSNNTGSEQSPLLSITKAIEKAESLGVTSATIHLKSDIPITDTLNITANIPVTIDGGNNSIQANVNHVVGTGSGAIAVKGGAPITFYNIGLTKDAGHNYATSILYVFGTQVNLDDVTISNGYKGLADVDDGGSGLYVANGATVTISGASRIMNNRPQGTGTSGAVYVQANGHLILNGVEIHSNTAASFGTGIYVQDSGILDIYSSGEGISVEDGIYLEAGSKAKVGATDGESNHISLNEVFLETELTSAKAMATLDICGETTNSNIDIEVDYDDEVVDVDDYEHFPYRLISNEVDYDIDNVTGQKDETGWEDKCGLWDIRYMNYNGVEGLYFYYHTIDATFHNVNTLTGIEGNDINSEWVHYYNPEEVQNTVYDSESGLLTIPELVALQDGNFKITFDCDELGKDYRIPTPDQVKITIDKGLSSGGNSTLIEGVDYEYTPNYEAGTAELIVYSDAINKATDNIDFEISAEKYYNLTLDMHGPLYTMTTSVTGQQVTSTLNVHESVSADGRTIDYRIERYGAPVEGITISLYQESLDGTDLTGEVANKVTDADGRVSFTDLDSSYSYYPILYYQESFKVIERDVIDVTLSVMEGQKMDSRYDYDSSETTVQYQLAAQENWSGASSTITDTHPADGETVVSYYVVLAEDVIRFHANQGEATTADTATFHFRGGDYSAVTTNPFTKTMEAAAETYGELPTMTMTGYIFDGWFTEPDGGEEVFAETAYSTNSSTKDLYAHWTPDHVGYKLQHWVELSPIHIDLVHEDANPLYEQGVTPTKQFNGKTYYLWSTDTLMDVDDDIADSTLDDVMHRQLTDMNVAHEKYTWWTLNGFNVSSETDCKVLADGSSVFSLFYDRNIYTINFDPGEGYMVGERTSQQARFGGDAGSDLTSRLPGLLVAARPGYVFGGWYYRPDTGNEVNVTATSWYTWTEDITLHARWMQSDTLYTIKIATEDKSYNSDGVAYGDDTYTLFKTVGQMPGISDQTMTVSVNDFDSLNVPGFTFKGYKLGLTSDDINSFDQSGSNLTPAGEDGTFTFAPNEFSTTVVYLYYTRNTADLTFMDDSKDSNPSIFDTADVVYGDVFGPSFPDTNPTKPGYDFVGWVDEDGKIITEDTRVDDYTSDGSVEMTIYPSWKARNYMITYVPGAGALFDVSGIGYGYSINSDVVGGYKLEKYVTYGDKMGPMPSASKPGYDFMGWYLSNGFDSDKNVIYGKQITPDTIVGVDNVIIRNDDNSYEGTHPLYAKYEPYWFNLRLDPGEDGVIANSGSNRIQVTYGEPIPTLPDAERTGYTFVGWMLDTGDSAGTRIESGDIWTYLTTNHSEVVAHAMYVPNSYTFTFNLNDVEYGNGSTKASLVDTTLDNVNIEFDGPFADVVNGIMAQRNGYVFLGWSFDTTQDNMVTDEILDEIPSETVLYAIWRPIVTEMRFYINGGDWNFKDEPSYTQYAQTYYEAFEREYPDYVNVNYGGSLEAVYKDIDKYWSVPIIFDTIYGDLGTPVRDDGKYEFGGWLASAPGWFDGQNHVIHGQIINSIDVLFTDYLDDYITLTAKWEAHMTFVIPNEGMTIGATFEDYTGETDYTGTSALISKDELEAAGELPNVIKDGFVLYGWYDVDEKKFVTLEQVLTMNTHHTFEAVLTPIVTFDANGGQVFVGGTGYDTYQIGIRTLVETYGELFTAEKDGLTFIGWIADDDTDVSSIENIRNRVEPITLTANYEVRVNFIIPHGAVWDDDKATSNKSYNTATIAGWTSLPTVTLTGYSFLGWYDENMNKLSLSDIQSINKSTDVYAYFDLTGGGDGDGDDEDAINVIVTDYTNGGATYVEPVDGWIAGTNKFIVTCEDVCTVALVRDEVATNLTCVKSVDGENTYEFTIDDVADGDEIVIVKRGDINLDGNISITDSSFLSRYIVGSYNLDIRECIQRLCVDINLDGDVSITDSSFLSRYLVGGYNFTWNVAD